MQIGLDCMLIRGGTSKGVYFRAEDLPADTALRDRVLLAIMGSPDKRQVDGLGGAHPLTSKAAIVSRSTLPGCDIDFLFAQVGVDKASVDTTPNCGNILAGIGPFALARGLVSASEPRTTIRVRTLNTGSIAELVMETEGGLARVEGEARIDGVPGTSAPIRIGFLDCAGVLRRLQDRAAAGQSAAGATRLFRRAHLRARGQAARRIFPHELDRARRHDQQQHLQRVKS